MGAENLAHTGIRSSDSTASSESLYRLSYPSPNPDVDNKKFVTISFVLHSVLLTEGSILDACYEVGNNLAVITSTVLSSTAQAAVHDGKTYCIT